MAIVPEKEKPLPFKEIDEVFTCDCGYQRCGCLVATMIDEHMAILEMVDESLLNIPVHWRLWKATKIFWQAFWHHSNRIEIVLNRKQNKQFKAFFATLKDERCHECDPDYLEGKGKYYQHGH
jgi:hypothetical protein